MRAERWLARSLIALALTVAACSEGGRDTAPVDRTATATQTAATPTTSIRATATPSREERLEAALATLTIDDLPGLMLSKSQVQATGLFVNRSDRSGFTSNLEVAESFPALGLTAADVEAWGRVAGHQVAFEPLRLPNGAAAAIEIGIDVFESSAGAAAYLAARREELSLSDSAITIVRREAFEVGRDGGEGLAIVASNAGYDQEISAAIAWIQQGRVISWASVIDFGRFDRSLSAERTAIVQAEQMEAVLTGERQPTKLVSKPRFPEFSQLVERPRAQGEPDLAQLTIGAASLPRPFNMTWSGYVVSPTIEHAYIRDFSDQPFVKFTTLPLSSMRVQTTWLPDGEDYGIFIDELRTRPIEALTLDMEAASGLRDLEIEVERPGYGETATLIIGRGSGSDGKYGYGAMWIDDGEFAIRLVVVGPSRLVTPEEIRAIAEAVAGQFKPPAG